MSVDYRLLHHFRVSQRREMASRGELPARFERSEPGLTDALEPRQEGAGRVERRRDTAAPRVQVLTHLLNEDR